MQVRFNPRMEEDLDSVGGRLRYAREKRGLKQDQLAKMSRVTQSTISKLEKGTTQETTKLSTLARALRTPLDWIELRRGPEPAWEDPDAAHSPLPHSDVSAGLMQTFEHVLTTMEELMGLQQVPARFVYALPDDAMGEFGRAGTEVLFHAADDAKPGAGVLVRDGAGALHVRRKAQGREDSHWLAIAPNRVYRDLDSERDSLKVLAVWRGVVNRGLEDV